MPQTVASCCWALVGLESRDGPQVLRLHFLWLGSIASQHYFSRALFMCRQILGVRAQHNEMYEDPDLFEVSTRLIAFFEVSTSL